MTFRSSGYSPGDRPCYSSSTASTAPIDNRLIVLIHQHPQEKKEASATAMLRCGKHAGVEILTALGGVTRPQPRSFSDARVKATDRTCRFPASEIPCYFPDRGLNREIPADLVAEFPGSLTEVPGSSGTGIEFQAIDIRTNRATPSSP